MKEKQIKNFLVPTVIDKTPSWERVYDIYSRLLEDRIIFLWDAIDSIVANTIIAQLLFLEKQDSKTPITMYINSPWWHVTAWLAIYDTMQLVKCPVHTVSVWLSASMATIILAWWEKWKRFALPNSEIMIHQPLWWAEWQAVDIKLAADHIIRTWARLYWILAKHTWKDVKQVERDSDRDNFMTAEEALKYGLVDKIIS
jgi:ATP-dependent Clp protease protease subunit